MADVNRYMTLPLGEQPLLDSFFARASRIGINLDFFLNVSGLICWTVALTLRIFNDDFSMLFVSMYFVLGFYQIISMLIGAIRGNKRKLIYVLFTIAFFGGWSVVADSADGTDNSLAKAGVLFYLGVIPMIGAVYYTKLCYDAKKHLKLDN